jgi:hypothetical protein
MRSATTWALYGLAVLVAWGQLGYLVIVANVGSEPLSSARALATCALLFLAPGLTFVPIARRLCAPLYEAEALAGWAAFGYVFIFLSPRATPSLGAFLVFVLPLTVALGSCCTLIAYLVGLRVYRGDARRHDFVRARRQGYLAAILLVAMALLHGIGVLTPAGAGLLALIGVSTEALLLTRSTPVTGGVTRTLEYMPTPRTERLWERRDDVRSGQGS